MSTVNDRLADGPVLPAASTAYTSTVHAPTASDGSSWGEPHPTNPPCEPPAAKWRQTNVAWASLAEKVKVGAAFLVGPVGPPAKLAVGACVPQASVWVSHIRDVPVVGDPGRILDAVDATGAHVVAVASHPDLAGQSLRRLSWALEERGVELVVSPGIVEVAGPRLSIRPVAGLSLLHLERPTLGGARMFAKTVFDRVLGGLLLLATAPLLALLAVAVRADSPGPVLFRQTRVGIDGRRFTMLKFRSMVRDAEERRDDLLDLDEGNGVLFKVRRDPRVTRVGSLLRRFSLDELPQLINVLRGDMSLVGPRPPLPEEVAEYDGDAVRRLRVRPGMTGLWQVSGRSDLSWEESLRLDLRYVDNWSMALDLSILWRTWRAVVRGAGAY